MADFLEPDPYHWTCKLAAVKRNLLGPHHHTMGEFCSVGPYSFISRDFEPGKYLPDINWSLPENRAKQESWSDDYFVVKFGLSAGIKIF